MRSSIYTSIFLLSRLTSSAGQIKAPINNGFEPPDDYADALDKLEKDIGSSEHTAYPKKLHKRATERDELKKIRREEVEKKKSLKSRSSQGGLSPEEIVSKTDEELREIYHKNQRVVKTDMDEIHSKVTEKLAGDLSDSERQIYLKKKEMIEKRKQRINAHDEKRAQKVRV
jgi:hypothetical protein